jgi:hypothetical protein
VHPVVLVVHRVERNGELLRVEVVHRVTVMVM